jgi:diguanylate cyclase (GGDEF)-like protein
MLLCWGPAPAVAAQAVAVAVVASHLRRSPREAVLALGQYSLSFAAAGAVLAAGRPDPMHHHTPQYLATDALTIVASIVVWLLVYGALELLGGRLAHTGPQRAGALRNTILFKSALLVLSPILAVAAHVNVGFVVFIFIPLYAVQRMAQLSAERDRATRTDTLTGLANRAGVKSAHVAMAGTLPRDWQITLLLADLDEFKHVNDALGHDVGDQLLVAVADRLARVRLVAGGVVARLGGDEFALLTVTADDLEAEQVAAELVEALAEPVSMDGLRVDITVSVGIANGDPGEDFATLMRHADTAMYDAKQAGSTVSTYAPGEHHDSAKRLALINDLRRALDGDVPDQIEMHYQPQMCLRTGDIAGVEALLRWHHPVHGLVNTQDLIAMVEHSSVMHRLTRRVIDDVVAQMGVWAEAGIELRTSINISSRDLYGDAIVDHLADRLAAHGVDPVSLQLEITESALLSDPSRTTGTIARLCRLGVAVALDDFGTGYSSLSHLRKLPISEIKIDRSFVAGMSHNHDDAAIVRSTVEMACSLGIRTVAEGVETEHTRLLLAEAGCTLAQGWLTAHPMPAADLGPWLTRRRLPAAA